jgi:iron complex outermembrane receptor protein
MPAPPIFIGGSHAGKLGHRVTPFKTQNMSGRFVVATEKRGNMKNHLMLLFLTLLALLIAHPVYAADLTGKVLDPDGNAVPNTWVRLFDRKTGEMRSTTSTAEGRYSFPGVPPGDYLLEGEASNAALNGSTTVALSGNKTQELRLALSGTSTTIFVTAASIPLSILEVGKAIDVIDSQELSQRNEFTLGEAVRMVPGVRVRTLEGPGSPTTIQTRGMRSSDTAVLVDGMRFRDASSITSDAGGFIENMVLTDTDRIEFLRGSGSSLYGSHALGGTVNILSRAGGGQPRGNLRVEGGGLGLVRGVADFSGGVAGDRFTYSGTASHLYVTKGVRDGLNYRNNSGQGSAKYSFAPGISVSGRLWYSNGYLTSTESPSFNPAVLSNSSDGTEVPAIPLAIDQLELFEDGRPFSVGNATYIPNTRDPDGRRQSSHLNGMLTFQHQVTPGTSYRVAYQSLDTRRTYLDGPLGTGAFDAFAAPRGNFDGFIDTVQVRLDQQAGRHNLLTFGYEFEQENYLSFDTGANRENVTNRIDLKQRSNSFFVQDQLRLLDGQLQFTVAARAQTFTLRDPEFQGFNNPYASSVSSLSVPTAYTGDGAVAYFLRPSQTKLRAHIGNSYRAPSGYERFGGGFGSYYGDPALEPERAVALDAGIDQWFWESKAQVGATWFYTNLQQRIAFVFNIPPADPFGRSIGYAGSTGGIARGFELSGNFYPAARTKIRASYTYVNSDSRTPTVGADYHSVLGVSPNIFIATATQWVGNRTNVTFDIAAHSDYTITMSGGGSRRFKFNGPIKPDVMVSHRLPFGDDHDMEIYGKVENMFGRQPYENGFVGAGAWFVSGVRINY